MSSQKNHKAVHTTEGHDMGSYIPRNSQREQGPIVVGLSLGATMCGVGYCSNIYDADPTIKTYTSWVNEFGNQTNTTPTAVLYGYNDHSTFTPFNFGYEAFSVYNAVPRHEDYFLCETYRTAYEKSKPSESLGQPLNLSTFLQYVLEELIRAVEHQLRKNQLLSDGNRTKRKWVITYPESMENSTFSLDTLKSIVLQVTGSGHFKLIREDLAVALWCTELPIKDFEANDDPYIPANAVLAVLDLQSEYLSVFRKGDREQPVKKLTRLPVKCDLNVIFMQLLSRKFDPEKIITYKSEHSKAWLQMLREFKIQIQGFKLNQVTSVNVSFHLTFVHFMEKGSSHKINDYMETDDAYVSLENESLKIKPEFFYKIFKSCSQRVLREIYTHVQLTPVEYMFLIGWSSVLDGFITLGEQSSGLARINSIKVPQDSYACALKGAVTFGKYF